MTFRLSARYLRPGDIIVQREYALGDSEIREHEYPIASIEPDSAGRVYVKFSPRGGRRLDEDEEVEVR